MVTRRSLINFAPTSKAATSVRTLDGRQHKHSCRTCRGIYTDACGEASQNGHCSACLTGHERPLWDKDLDPRPCCVGSQMMEDRTEVVRYALGGPGPWYQCSTCSRQHPYLVKEVP